MKFFVQLQKLLSKVLGVICVVVFAALVLDVLWGAFSREVLNNQGAWTEELARLLLVWIAILGGVLAYAGDRHLGVDVLVSHFHPSTHRLAKIFTHLCVLFFAVSVLLIGGILLFNDRLASGQMLATLGIQKAWVYFVLPVGGFLIAFLAIEKILLLLQPTTEKEESA